MQHLTIVSRTKFSITVSWKAPNRSWGILRGFWIEYVKKEEKEESSEQVVIKDFVNLKFNSFYLRFEPAFHGTLTIQVWAENRHNNGTKTRIVSWEICKG